MFKESASKSNVLVLFPIVTLKDKSFCVLTMVPEFNKTLALEPVK
jgi:hypothetical protein